MIRRISVFLAFMLLAVFLAGGPARACVGRTLYIGSLDRAEEMVMTELLALLINERTGTSVQTRYFKNSQELYAALKSSDEKQRADIIVEDTGDAMGILNQARAADLNSEYTTAKELYDKELNIVWLNPFGYTNSKERSADSISAPLVRRDVLTNFPLLPRILNKLAGAIDNETYTKLQERVRSGDKARNVAQDFLKAKKFI